MYAVSTEPTTLRSSIVQAQKIKNEQKQTTLLLIFPYRGLYSTDGKQTRLLTGRCAATYMDRLLGHAYTQVGGRTAHDYRDMGGRVTPGAVNEDARAENGTRL